MRSRSISLKSLAKSGFSIIGIFHLIKSNILPFSTGNLHTTLPLSSPMNYHLSSMLQRLPRNRGKFCFPEWQMDQPSSAPPLQAWSNQHDTVPFHCSMAFLGGTAFQAQPWALSCPSSCRRHLVYTICPWVVRAWVDYSLVHRIR